MGTDFLFDSQAEDERKRSDRVGLPSEIEATGTTKQAAQSGGNAPKSRLTTSSEGEDKFKGETGGRSWYQVH
jgi:hypothetical protein